MGGQLVQGHSGRPCRVPGVVKSSAARKRSSEHPLFLCLTAAQVYVTLGPTGSRVKKWIRSRFCTSCLERRRGNPTVSERQSAQCFDWMEVKSVTREKTLILIYSTPLQCMLISLTQTLREQFLGFYLRKGGQIQMQTLSFRPLRVTLRNVVWPPSCCDWTQFCWGKQQSKTRNHNREKEEEEETFCAVFCLAAP